MGNRVASSSRLRTMLAWVVFTASPTLVVFETRKFVMMNSFSFFREEKDALHSPPVDQVSAFIKEMQAISFFSVMTFSSSIRFRQGLVWHKGNIKKKKTDGFAALFLFLFLFFSFNINIYSQMLTEVLISFYRRLNPPMSITRRST
jgi:hypothetical protein